MNTVKEMFVDGTTREIILEMRTRPIIDLDYEDDTTPAPKQPGEDKWRLSLGLFSGPPQKLPLAGLRILVRDSEGKSQAWYQTDATGRIVAILPEAPTFVTLPMVVVPRDGKVYTFMLNDGDCAVIKQQKYYPRGATCISVKGRSVEIEIPPADSPNSTPGGAPTTQPHQ
jgi:hypothetical protein